MNQCFIALLCTISMAITVFAQPGKNVEFSYYERNPTLFVILLSAFVVLIIVLAIVIIKRRK